MHSSKHDNFDRIAVIVINQNGQEHLQECIQSLLDCSPPNMQIILLDNASQDNSVSFTQDHFPKVQIFQNSKNLGFAGGYNAAIKKCDADHVVILNNDTKVTPFWLQPLFEEIQKEHVGICGSRLMCYTNQNLVDHNGGFISISGGGVDRKKGAPFDEDSQKNPFSTGFACGAAFMISKELFETLGGFDEDHIIYHEDVDLGWKCWLAGYQVMHAPNSVVLHKGSASMGHFEQPHRLFLSQRNRFFNLIRNASPTHLIFGILVNLGFDMLRILKWTLKLNFKNTLALLKAYGSILKHLPKKLKERKKIQKNKKQSLRDIRKKYDVFSGPIESFKAYIAMK